MKIVISSAFGLEAITKNELIRLGVDNPKAFNGRIYFEGSMREVSRCNMFLRSAERVLIEVTRFPATTFDELYDGIIAINWQDFIPKGAFIHIIAKCVKSKLFALSACQSITKKAIITKLQQVYKSSTTIIEDQDEFRLEVAIEQDIATLSIDTSGMGLHKRGYRTLVAEAPLKETIASSMIMLSRYRGDYTLMDCFCGSGTIPIESAMIARNIAPGINRNFLYQHLDDGEINYKLAKEEAHDIIDYDKKLRIYGYDIDSQVLKLARHHAQLAGVDKDIHFQQMDMRDVAIRYDRGIIITNPPYGERLMSPKEVAVLYQDFSKMYRSLGDWQAYVITSFPQFEKFFGRADKNRKIFNAQLECRAYQYFGRKNK